MNGIMIALHLFFPCADDNEFEDVNIAQPTDFSLSWRVAYCIKETSGEGIDSKHKEESINARSCFFCVSACVNASLVCYRQLL